MAEENKDEQQQQSTEETVNAEESVSEETTNSEESVSEETTNSEGEVSEEATNSEGEVSEEATNSEGEVSEGATDSEGEVSKEAADSEGEVSEEANASLETENSEEAFSLEAALGIEPEKNDSEVVDEENDEKKKKGKKKLELKKLIGFVLVFIQVVLMVLAIISISKLHFFPVFAIVLFTIVLLLFLAFNLATQFGSAHIIGKVMTVIWIALLFVVMSFASKYSAVFKSVSGLEEPAAKFSVLVKMEDDAKDVLNTYSYVYGITQKLDKELTNQTIVEVMRDDNNIRPILTEFNSITEMYDGLMSGKARAIIFNEKYRTMMEEVYPTFTQKTRILASYEPKTAEDVLVKENKKAKKEKKVDKDITKECFTIFINANEKTDEAANVGKSTINAMLTINPKSHQVLVVGMPSNMLMPVKLDSLHGTDTLSNVVQLPINDVKKIIGDYWGGSIDYYVSVHMDEEMSNYVNGKEEEELLLVTDLYKRIGSFQKVNQSGYAGKAASLVKADMSEKNVSRVVKMFMFAQKKWNVTFLDMSGNTQSHKCDLFNSNETNVLIANDDDVAKATNYMQQIINGDKIW